MDEPSRLSRPVAGVPSGLTDPERYCLAALAVERVMRDMDVSEDTARGLLAHASGQGRCMIAGDPHLVGLFVDQTPLVVVERSWLRGVIHPEVN
jgi:hypothetical protein